MLFFFHFHQRILKNNIEYKYIYTNTVYCILFTMCMHNFSEGILKGFIRFSKLQTNLYPTYSKVNTHTHAHIHINSVLTHPFNRKSITAQEWLISGSIVQFQQFPLLSHTLMGPSHGIVLIWMHLPSIYPLNTKNCELTRYCAQIHLGRDHLLAIDMHK